MRFRKKISMKAGKCHLPLKTITTMDGVSGFSRKENWWEKMSRLQ
jgi:hypothetical protein